MRAFVFVVNFISANCRRHCRHKLFLCLIAFALLSVVKLWTYRSNGSVADESSVSFAIFVYQPPSQNLSAEPFVVSKPYLDQIGFPMADNFVELDKKTVGDFVFATAADDSYFMAAIDAIASIQQFFPTRTILFYDLNKGATAPDTASKISSLCNVKYRKFDFDRHPSHVAYLQFYAWKPIIVHEVLREFSGVFWVDASIRLRTNNLTSLFRRVVDERIGVMSFDSAGHSIFPATHQALYRYLPISVERAVNSTMVGAGCTLWYRTKPVYQHVLKWWLLCALVKDCIAPTTDIYCKFHGNAVYAKCHRFDQSSLNVLMTNFAPSGYKHYVNFEGILTVNRGDENQVNVSVCSNSTERRIVLSTEYFPPRGFLSRLISEIDKFISRMWYHFA